MSRLAPIPIVAAALLIGCAQSPQHDAVLAALTETVGAIESRDWRQVWTLSAPAAREELTALHGLLVDAVAAVDEVYPEDQRDLARSSVGAALVAGIVRDSPTAGEELLGRLLAPEAVRLDEKGRAGLHATGAVIDDDRAVIHTAAGETFTFQQDLEGQWRSRLVMDILDEAREVTILRENATAVLQAARERRRTWQSARDARTPQGAYNLARGALEREPTDADTLFALLDQPGRDALVTALETARSAQKKIQRSTPRNKRDAAYAEHGIALHVVADSDRSLFGAWVDDPAFVPPLKDESPPDRVEGDPEGGPAVVVSESGARIGLSRDAEGLWHLTGYTKVLDAQLVVPARKALERLDAPP